MKASKLAKIVNGKLLGSDKEVISFEFDSRICSRDSLFIALKGKRDGHEFLEDAFRRGTVGALVEKEIKVPDGKFIIVVEDTLKAFRDVAVSKRKSFTGTVIALTGSVGKTTTKEFLHFFLARNFSVYSNVKSYNNLIGVSYTLSNLPNDAEIYIQEIGTNKKGEVAELREIVNPNIAIVTHVGKAHTENFKSLKEIAEEKLSITENSELAVIPHQFKNLSKGKKTITFGKNGDIRLKEIKLKKEGTNFLLEIEGKEEEFFTPVPGYSMVNTTMIAAAVSLQLGTKIEKLKEAVFNFQPPTMRMNILKLRGLTLIDDSYNANPISMENAIKVLSLYKGKKVAILGEMLELDNSIEEHKKLGNLLEKNDIDTVITIGENTAAVLETFSGEAYHFKNRKELLKFIEQYDFSGCTVLVKGSRGNRLEEAVEILKKRYKG